MLRAFFILAILSAPQLLNAQKTFKCKEIHDAIKLIDEEKYDEGLKKFPNSRKLHLEKGVIFEFENKLAAALEIYEAGMKGISKGILYQRL
ncbi:hypothetical protein [Chryseobacterium sp. BIGb0232]|uniref:hypothetical protein n=1 Tax=Chryseobacterium sp. BIGb0232 TaxID=2940598 RepID=UPI000F4A3F90|nr:hypothetical protein [Chryseobacterium sp. BIGb0232]MCS4301513.1 hypothetical protein [Chryseobacterium sp. BIGb0232]ROS19630.1 hypothetical protein EDF65_0322 [Chryseobacterium nakagawai]